MYCPKCGNKAEGKQCTYCGAILEIDENFELNPYGTSGNNMEDTLSNFSIPEDYYREEASEDAVSAPKGVQKENNNKKSLIILISVISVAIILAIALIVVKTTGDEKEADSAAIEVSAVESLKEKGQKYMDTGDYESAEKIYKELMETDDDKEISTIYKILYNFNRAVLELDDYDYKSASKFFEKIPEEYTEYAIYDDVDMLGDEISRFQAAYEIFESIETFIAEGNYSAAREAIGILDEDALSKENKEALMAFEKEISENEKKEVVLYEHDAEDLIMGYCDSFVKAVNQKDFDIVAPYIYENSPMYNEQKALAESYIKDNILESFDSFKLVNLTKSSDTSWQARVSENKTINYPDGEKTSKTYNRIYTIEYIDSSFYLTGVK